MCTEHEARHAAQEIGFQEGLAAEEIHKRIGRACRLQDVGRRYLAFYLHETADKGLQKKWGQSQITQYARVHFGLSPRRTRELVWVGKKLRGLPLVDRAFCDHEICWTKVITLLRVVSPEHEAEWVEKAKDVSLQVLKRDVLRAREGGPPPKPGQTKGLRDSRFPERMILGVIPHKMQELAKAKLSEEMGRPATSAELQEVMLGIYLDMEIAGGSPKWNRVSVSKFRILLRPGAEDATGHTSLFVETEDGLLPIDGSGSGNLLADIIARTRTACACCDGEMVGDDHEPIDVPTPAPLRTRALKRDGYRCRCCGARDAIHVHHIVYRAGGGRTKLWNLISTCERCHALIHDGLLVIEGTSQRSARFVDSEGRSVHEAGKTIDPSVLMRIAPPEPPSLLQRGTRIPEELTTLDTVPAIVDRTWWRRNADLITDRGTRGLELRAGRPNDASAESEEAPRQRQSFDEAFDGLVGRTELLERLRSVAAGTVAKGAPFPHTLLTGPAGTGKTTVAEAIASSCGSRVVKLSGPLLQDVHGLVCQLASLRGGDVFLLDEIHAVPRAVLETLYEAMENRSLSLRLHSGTQARTVCFEVASFTLVAATTEPAQLPAPFKTRFQITEHLEFYEEEALVEMATASAEDLGFELASLAAAALLARHARGVPRKLLQLLTEVCQVADGEGHRRVDEALVRRVLKRMGYDSEGFTRAEREYLTLLVANDDPIAGDRLAPTLGMDEGTVKQGIEPWLIHQGWLRITPRGRSAGPRLVAMRATPQAEAV